MVTAAVERSRGEATDGKTLARMFVYGTLRTGQAARSLIASHVVRSDPATLAGRMYAFLDGYPGVIADEDGGEIRGEVLELRDLAAAFALLDAYEGDDFIRVQVTPRLSDGREIDAWCYVLANDALADGAELVTSGDWVTFEQDY